MRAAEQHLLFSSLPPRAANRKKIDGRTQAGGNQAEEAAKVTYTHTDTHTQTNTHGAPPRVTALKCQKDTQCTAFIKSFHTGQQETDAFMSHNIKPDVSEIKGEGKHRP